MAMRAALRSLSANFSPRLPQLSSAAQVSAARLLWRSNSPRTLSTTPALSTGKYNKNTCTCLCKCAVMLHTNMRVGHTFLLVCKGRNNSRTCPNRSRGMRQEGQIKFVFISGVAVKVNKKRRQLHVGS